MGLLSRKVRKQARKLGVSYSFLFMQANGAQLRELAALYDAGHLRPRHRQDVPVRPDPRGAGVRRAGPRQRQGRHHARLTTVNAACHVGTELKIVQLERRRPLPSAEAETARPPPSVRPALTVERACCAAVALALDEQRACRGAVGSRLLRWQGDSAAKLITRACSRVRLSHISAAAQTGPFPGD